MNKPPIDKFMHNDWVYIHGGTFMLGSKYGYPEEKPVHKVTPSPFWICKYNIKGAEFEIFPNGKAPSKDFLEQSY